MALAWYFDGSFILHAPVVEMLDNAIHSSNVCPVNNAIISGFANTFLLDSDLLGGWHNPMPEQPGPGCSFLSCILIYHRQKSHVDLLCSHPIENTRY